MKFMDVNIATARIEDLDTSPCYSTDYGCYIWTVTFDNASTGKFRNFITVSLDSAAGKSVAIRHQIRLNFSEAGIREGDRVAVIFRHEGSILAIGKIRGEDVWIDATDEFKKKSFAELNIVVTGLSVY